MASLRGFSLRQGLFVLVALGALGSAVAACSSNSSTGVGAIPTSVPIGTPVPTPVPTPTVNPNPSPTASVIIIIGAKYHRDR